MAGSVVFPRAVRNLLRVELVGGRSLNPVAQVLRDLESAADRVRAQHDIIDC